MLNPLISIIVPIYNVEPYLPDCLESLQGQTYQNLEILLVDDGSTDRSLAVCKQYAARDPRYKVLHKENGGLGSARNYGLKHATGQYIGFVDSDDFVDSRFVEVLYQTLVRGDYDFSMVAYQPTSGRTCQAVPPVSDSRTLSTLDLINGLYNNMPSGFGRWNDIIFRVVWNKLYKREILQDIEFPTIPIAEDFEYNNQVFLRTRKAIFTPVPLYYYYSRPGSIAYRPDGKKLTWQIMAHFRCLNMIPVAETSYRAISLVKLYKAILSVRYSMRRLPYTDDVQSFHTTVRKIIRQTFREMVQNRLIPLKMKSSLLLFAFFPGLYSFFLSWNEKKASRQK